MRKSLSIALLAQATLFSSIPLSAEEPSASGFSAQSPCQDSERWSYSKNLSESWQEEFENSLKSHHSKVRGFSQALALRRQSATNADLKTFGEYWIARSLYGGKLTHVSYSGMSLIASYPVTREIAPIQIAALECLNQIQLKFPSFELKESVIKRFQDLAPHAKTSSERFYFSASILWAIKQQISFARGQKTDLKPLIAILETVNKEKEFVLFAKALEAMKSGRFGDAAVNFGTLTATPLVHPYMSRHSDQIHLLHARALYSLGKFNAAQTSLKRVKKNSNELAKTLSELAWAYLMDEKYGEAIGTALSFQAGGLRNTFAPEAPMVAAMALNEICQFPESVKAINTFKKHYEKPYRWLDAWSKNKSAPLYPQAIAYLSKKSDVPSRVGSEWLRSPVFLANQGEINLMLDERDASVQWARAGGREQKKLATDIHFKWKELKAKIQKMRANAKTSISLPPSIIVQLRNLKSDITAFRRYYHAAPASRNLLANHELKVPGTRARLIAEINDDLRTRTAQMHTMIGEVAENNQLIEVEIYNGASQDIIWQNAHPEYKELAKQMKDQAEKKEAEKVWDWGRSPSQADDEGAEIWEDELGSFKADLYDNCSSKDKYLALKSKGNS